MLPSSRFFPAARAAASACAILASALVLSGCTHRLRQPSVRLATDELLAHLERVGQFESEHYARAREYTADLPNGLRVKGLTRAAVVLTTEGQFVGLAWYQSGNGPVCRVVAAAPAADSTATPTASGVTTTCLDELGRVLHESRHASLRSLR